MFLSSRDTLYRSPMFFAPGQRQCDLHRLIVELNVYKAPAHPTTIREENRES